MLGNAMKFAAVAGAAYVGTRAALGDERRSAFRSPVRDLLDPKLRDLVTRAKNFDPSLEKVLADFGNVDQKVFDEAVTQAKAGNWSGVASTLLKGATPTASTSAPSA